MAGRQRTNRRFNFVRCEIMRFFIGRYSILLFLLSILTVKKTHAQSQPIATLIQYNELGNQHFQTGRYDSAKHYFSEGLRLFPDTAPFQELDSATALWISKTRVLFGQLLFRQSEYSTSIIQNQKAIELAKQIAAKKQIGRAYYGLGATYAAIGKTELSNDSYREAVHFSREAEDTLGLSLALNNIGMYFFHQKDYQQALIFFQESLQLSNSLQTQKTAVFAYANIGLTYLKLSNKQKAKAYLDSTISQACPSNDIFCEVSSLTAFGEYYLATNNFDRAVSSLDKAIALNEQINNFSGIAKIYFLLAKLHIRKGNLQEAKKTAQHGHNIASCYHLAHETYQGLKIMASIADKQGEHEKAYQLLKQYKSMKDSLTVSENKTNLYELSITYRVDLQKQKIKQQKKELALIAAKNNAKRIEIVFYIGLLVTVGLIFAFVISVFKGRLKTGKELKEQQEVIGAKKAELAQQIRLLQEKMADNKVTNEEIKAQRDHFESQKQEIKNQMHTMELQQTELLHSLMYARRIQTAVFSAFLGKKHSMVNDFHAFVAGDILSTSFVWKAEYQDNVVYVIVDSKSSGVLNALASLLTFTQMDAWFSKSKRFRAFQIQKFLTQKLDDILAAYTDTLGLYLSVFILSPKFGHIDFSGSHNLLIADKNKTEKVQEWHEEKTFQLNTSNLCYIFSFAYEDFLNENQKNKSFFIEDVLNKPLSEQKSIIEANIPSNKNKAKTDYFVLGIGLTQH